MFRTWGLLSCQWKLVDSWKLENHNFQRMCDREFGKLNPVALFQGGDRWKQGHRRKEAQGGISQYRNSWVHGKGWGSIRTVSTAQWVSEALRLSWTTYWVGIWARISKCSEHLWVEPPRVSQLTFNQLIFNYTLKHGKWMGNCSCVAQTKLLQLREKWVFLRQLTWEHLVSPSQEEAVPAAARPLPPLLALQLWSGSRESVDS